MKATVTSPESWKKVIEVEIPAETITAQFDKKVKKYSKEVNVPGFRKGKIPAKIVIARFGDNIRGEVTEEAMNNAFRDACVENKITPEKINSYIFIENWYINENTLQIHKEVVGIAPVSIYYDKTDEENKKPLRKIPFVVYFDSNKKF